MSPKKWLFLQIKHVIFSPNAYNCSKLSRELKFINQNPSKFRIILVGHVTMIFRDQQSVKFCAQVKICNYVCICKIKIAKEMVSSSSEENPDGITFLLVNVQVLVQMYLGRVYNYKFVNNRRCYVCIE